MTAYIDDPIVYRNRVEDTANPKIFDDFLGKTISGQWGVQKGSDGGTVNFAHSAALSGMARATTGANAGGTHALNGVQLDSQLNFQANQGGLIFEAKVKISAITNVAIFVGLTDQIASLEEPFSLAVTTYTSTATDAVGFLFDTAATAATIRCVGVANDVDVTHVNSSLAYVAATYRKFRIEVAASGAAAFYIDDTLVTSIAACVTATIPLTPVITATSRAAASRNIDADWILVSHAR